MPTFREYGFLGWSKAFAICAAISLLPHTFCLVAAAGNAAGGESAALLSIVIGFLFNIPGTLFALIAMSIRGIGPPCGP
jgi:hypothetical protein